MTDADLDLLSRLWEEHLRTPFPPHMRGREFAYEGEVFDMVLLDADIAGCISSSLTRPLDQQRREVLATCLAVVESVLPSIEVEDHGFAYYRHLREMAALAIRIGNADAGLPAVRDGAGGAV
ncbi:hypothetical protein ACFVW2_24710 [Streptomyces sp. NPDC058171]